MIEIVSKSAKRVVHLTTLEDLVTWKEFLWSGMRVINDKLHSLDVVDMESFFSTIAQILTWEEGSGAVALLLDNEDPLAFAVVFDATIPRGPKTLFAFAIYSNKKYPAAIPELYAHAEEWMQQYGYTRMTTAVPNDNGSTRRLFQKRGFVRTSTIYTKEVYGSIS